MSVAGIDIGGLATKVVILEGDRILAATTLMTGETGETEAHKAMEEALRQAGLKLEEIKSVISTGTGRKRVPFAQKQRTAMSCHAKGAYFLFPQVRTVIDVVAKAVAAGPYLLGDQFTAADVVRHPLVQEIIRAYEHRGGAHHRASPTGDPSKEKERPQ